VIRSVSTSCAGFLGFLRGGFSFGGGDRKPASKEETKKKKKKNFEKKEEPKCRKQIWSDHFLP
jgi:hypothetical protein